MTTAPAARSARLQAQAKINLSLRVLARAVDGYHQLETLFQRLTLADSVSLTVTNGARSLDMSGPDSVDVEQNLAWRAAVAYERQAGWPAGWKIEIDKRIPMGGGLGGGSADAGATLRLLDRLNPDPVGAGALLEVAAGIGADVPFLTASAPLAVGWGRGERLLALPPLPPRPVALLLFPFGISTAQAFGWLAESRTGGGDVPPAGLLETGSLSNWKGILELAVNDLETPVFGRHPELEVALEQLRAWIAPSAAGAAGAAGAPGAPGAAGPAGGVAPGAGMSSKGLANGESGADQPRGRLTDAERDNRGRRDVLARMTGTGSTLFAIPVEGPLAPPIATRDEWAGGGRLELAETAPRVEEAELIE